MIYYTGHAKERMILRGITEEMVKRSLLNPEKTGFGYGGRNLIFKKFKKGTIKIVFVKKKSSYIIISVIWQVVNKK